MYLFDEVKKNIVEFLSKEFKPEFSYLFGSFARGEGREDSDIDLAIYTDKVISAYDLLIAAGKLSFEINKDVQIVHLSVQYFPRRLWGLPNG